jgi:hypothetical protein
MSPTHYLAAHKDGFTTDVPPFGQQTFGLDWIPKARRYIVKKDGVVISHVDWKCYASCPGYMPVSVVGKDENGDIKLDAQSALWKPGEVFKAAKHGVKVKVLQRLGENAYRVKITLDG